MSFEVAHGAIDMDTVKIWLQAGIPPVIPSALFRTRVVPMGETLFYGEIKAKRLKAVKSAGKTCITIEEAVRYKNALPSVENSQEAA